MDLPTLTEIKKLFDIDFIRENEGGCQLKPYVPPIAASGVTIATGIDLGQQSASDMLDLGIPKEMVARYKPYFGLRRQDAEVALKTYPFMLEKWEADILDGAYLQRDYRASSAAYNRSATNVCTMWDTKGKYSPVREWHNLPYECRTVHMDLVWNMGRNIGSSCPRFWYFFSTNQWLKLQMELNNFGHSIHSLTLRRQREAELLSKVTGENPKQPCQEKLPDYVRVQSQKKSVKSKIHSERSHKKARRFRAYVKSIQSRRKARIIETLLS